MKISSYLLLACVGCTAPGTPEAPEATRTSTTPTAEPPAPERTEPASSGEATAEASATVTASPAPAVPTFAPPPLLDEAGSALPQTDTLPSVDSPFFQELGKELFAAIVEDAPERAKPFFFPLVAYQQVKDIADAPRDHEKRLLHHFARDIHTYHRKLGADVASATFVRIDVPMARAKWMKPGSEGNKLGYHRVTRSNIVYRDARGTERKLELTSLISWRGEWYVVHLHGFE